LAAPAVAAGVVSDCTTYGSTPGTLDAALTGGGLVTFACSGTITVTQQIPVDAMSLILDATGQKVILSGGGTNRIFDVGIDAGLELRHLTLTAGHEVNAGGGAIRTGGHLTITNSTLTGNSAIYGGAIELFNGEMQIVNSTLADNRATGGDPGSSGGGAIDMYFKSGGSDASSTHPQATIVHSTVIANTAAEVEGVYARSGIWQENGQLTIQNSIVAGNGGGDCVIDPLASASPAFFGAPGANLDSDGDCHASIGAAPLTGALGDNGGPTPTYALLPGSPAIDAVPVGACLVSVDQRGVLRPRDGNRDGLFACDLGALEYADRFYTNAAVVDGLAGYWPFDESTGATTADATGHGLTGSLLGDAGFTAAAAPVLFSNSAALVSGPGGGVQVADAAVLNPANGLTLAAWVRVKGTAGQQPIVTKVGSPTGGYRFGVRDGALFADIWNNTNTQYSITGGVVIADAWMHLAVTWRTGDKLTGYINGVPVATTSVNAAPLGVSNAALNITVDGAVDDVRVYARALTAGQIGVLASGRSCITTATSWADAVSDLQCVLADALPGGTVWVTQGRYTPTRGPARAATFTVGDGVAVYGGFAGGESALTQREPSVRRTVLSGDIERNDRTDAVGVVTSPLDVVGNNAYHVVTIDSTTNTTVLDGFTVTAGQADGAAADGNGGGIVSRGGGPLLRNAVVIGNRASGNGGGLWASLSNPVLISVTVLANQAGNGGGLFAEGGAPVLVNALVAGNRALARGGGIYTNGSGLHLVNVSVGGNQADAEGGGLFLANGAPILVNSVVGDNGAPAWSQTATNSAVIRHSLVEDGCPPGATCIGVVAADPLFVDPVLSTAAPSSGGNYHLLPASLAIDAGENDADLGGYVPDGSTIAAFGTDLAGNARFLPVQRMLAVVDAGAYEIPNSPPIITSAPVTIGMTTLTYIYTATAADPNDPAGASLQFIVSTKPAWLAIVALPPGAVVASGAPRQEDLDGSFLLSLRVVDPAGAAAEQSFEITVLARNYPIYMPLVRKTR